jgi:hypothetical protein
LLACHGRPLLLQPCSALPRRHRQQQPSTLQQHQQHQHTTRPEQQQQQQGQLSRAPWPCRASASAAGGDSSSGPEAVVFSPLELQLGALCKTFTNLFPL